MCGIIGCSLSRPLITDDIKSLRRMRDALAHRGPDDGGEYYDVEQGVYLGHRRLSIVDLDPRSAQPMKSNEHVLAYNGEVYNYKSIQKQFFVNEQFKTTSDTEVVLKSWQKWGRAALDKFDGMFALALWDGQGLNLVTDFFGEKPLYTYTNEDGVYFSSEAGALIEAFNLSFEPTEEERLDFLYLGYIRPPHTGFENLKTIKPAQHLEVKQGKLIKQETYWSAPSPYIGQGKIHPIPDNDIDQIRDILCESLECRFQADVPVGLFLSGGVDSTLIAALAAKELHKTVETYTVAFPDGYDENAIAQNIASTLGLPHTTINSADGELWKCAPQHIADIYGVPNDNMTALAVYQMCEIAKKYLTVAISGLGGDELFYGYNKYNLSFKYRHLYKNAALLAPISKLAGPFLPKARLLNDLMKGGQDRQYLRIKNDRQQSILEELTIKSPEDILLKYQGDLVHNLQYYDINMSMPQSFIPAIDRGSMKASVEVRTPFLSRKLLSYVYTLDQRSLIAFGQKNVLKTLLSRYLNPDLLYQGKQGFVFPATRYYRECAPEAPVIAELKPSMISSIWAEKENPAFQQLVIRLSILENFYSNGCTPTLKNAM